ncbi:WD40 repeat domain-containing protein [Capnocytophaga canimorsus]|uniref:WD40 repeat domain-containing protein n=1 Tax=Capnocytophaga canimorsus TaxID=28188 RepID=UPI001EDD59D5|nr:WD40 repeat domain-containing protein [Capnocytophaga canimorsus]GJQ05151.1 hypothetical protein CAPN009_15660 [Capnocytophaga canimorsus]
MKAPNVFIIFFLFNQFIFGQIELDYKNSDFYSGVSIVGLSEKGNLYVHKGSTLWKIDLNVGEVEQQTSETRFLNKNIDFSKDEKYLIVQDLSGITVWDKGKIHKKWENRLDFGVTRLKSNKANHNFALSNNKKIQIWNAEIGQLVDEFHTEKVIQTLYYTPDGNYLLIGTENCDLILWDTKQKKIRYKTTLNNCEDARGILDLSSFEDKYILSGIRHADTRLIDFQTGTEIKRFKSFGASTLAFGLEGKNFYEGSGQGAVTVNELKFVDIDKGTAFEIDDESPIWGYSDFVYPSNFHFWIVKGDGIEFWSKKDNIKLLDLFFHQDKNDSSLFFWNAIDYRRQRVGGQSSRFLLQRGVPISEKDNIFDKNILQNALKTNDKY